MSKDGTKIIGKTKTQQHMTDATNINKLIEKHGVHNIQVQDRPLQYLDISNVGTLHEMQNHVKKVEQKFMQLPPRIRSEFKNKSSEFSEFMMDEKNHPKAWAMGLMDDDDGLLQDAWEKLHPTQEQIREKAVKDAEPTPVGDKVIKTDKVEK